VRGERGSTVETTTEKNKNVTKTPRTIFFGWATAPTKRIEIKDIIIKNLGKYRRGRGRSASFGEKQELVCQKGR